MPNAIAAPLPTFDQIRAGKATLTVENPQGDHVTFMVVAPGRGNSLKREEKIRFVKVMTGSDNDAHYTYVGILNPTEGVKLTKASKLVGDNRVSVVAWAIRCIVRGSLPEGYQIRHAGACLRCGRKLTNPESLDVMFGPECAGKV